MSSILFWNKQVMGEPRDATSAAGYQFAKKPPEVTFGQFLYNSGTGEILGRTPISWCKQLILI